mmetsp:Transcript_24955/g.59986  ORF Transcript_24955/g.59986 Transcript_24955/m.59986 type:complete len:329 (-) Transcript_24955:978-1964(-)
MDPRFQLVHSLLQLHRRRLEGERLVLLLPALEREEAEDGKEGHIVLQKRLVHVVLQPVVLLRVLVKQEEEEEEVFPCVPPRLTLFPLTRVVVEDKAFDARNETLCLEVGSVGVALVSHLGEGVNDLTLDDALEQEHPKDDGNDRKERPALSPTVVLRRECRKAVLPEIVPEHSGDIACERVGKEYRHTLEEAVAGVTAGIDVCRKVRVRKDRKTRRHNDPKSRRPQEVWTGEYDGRNDELSVRPAERIDEEKDVKEGRVCQPHDADATEGPLVEDWCGAQSNHPQETKGSCFDPFLWYRGHPFEVRLPLHHWLAKGLKVILNRFLPIF